MSKYFINDKGEHEIKLPESFSSNVYSVNVSYNYSNAGYNAVTVKMDNYYHKETDRFIVIVDSPAEMEVLFTCIGN